MQTIKRIGLGGGCHWCTEGVFVSLRGVVRVEQGWIASSAPNAAFSEAVIVHFDPQIISAEDLIAVHLETHSATADHPLRQRYRSAVYYFEEQQRKAYEAILARLGSTLSKPLQTRVLAYVAFKSSLPEHLDYYRTDPSRPFCRKYITPKLNDLRRNRAGLLKKSILAEASPN